MYWLILNFYFYLILQAFFSNTSEERNCRGSILIIYGICIRVYFMNVQVYMTLIPVVVGIVLASNSEPLFNIYGFIACFIATFARALKSVLQGLLLTNETEKMDSLNLLLFMSPFALGNKIFVERSEFFQEYIGILVFSAFIMERNAWTAVTNNCEKSYAFTITLALNCLIAYLVNLSNFLVTKCTSPLTLQVLGNAKVFFLSILTIHNFSTERVLLL